jgi:hypothetical protein
MAWSKFGHFNAIGTASFMPTPLIQYIEEILPLRRKVVRLITCSGDNANRKMETVLETTG